jgi:hypothetical protein
MSYSASSALINQPRNPSISMAAGLPWQGNFNEILEGAPGTFQSLALAADLGIHAGQGSARIVNFTFTMAQFGVRGDARGGRIQGTVVGFSPNVAKTVRLLEKMSENPRPRKSLHIRAFSPTSGRREALLRFNLFKEATQLLPVD